jgi:hypothetical protein
MLIKWVLPRLLRKNMPVFTRIGMDFEESVYTQRRRADEHGLYAAINKHFAEAASQS